MTSTLIERMEQREGAFPPFPQNGDPLNQTQTYASTLPGPIFLDS